MEEAPDCPDLVIRMAQEQARIETFFLHANQLREQGDYRQAVQAYREYRQAQQRYLDLALRDNRLGCPSPWEIEPIAQPLVQQAMMEAALREALGDSAAAGSLRDWALGLAREHLSASALARLRREEATRLARSGRFNAALLLLAQVRGQFGRAKAVLEEAQTALDQAVLLEWLGDHERALEAIASAKQAVAPHLRRGPEDRDVGAALLREALSIFNGGGPTGEAGDAAALWRITVELDEHEARVRKELGDLDEAARLFLTVLPEYERLGVRAAIDYQLVAIDLRRGRPEEARSRLRAIAPAFEQDRFRPRRAGLRILQADAELEASAPERALELAEDGVADLERFPDFDLAWKLHWRRARALQGLGRPDAALHAYGEAAEIVDSLRKVPLGYRLDSTYLGPKLPLFESAIDLAADRGDGQRCCRLIELVKARALAPVLSVPPERRATRSALETEFDHLTRRLDAIEYESYRGAATVQLRAEHDRLLARRRDVAEQIRLADPRWRSLSAPVPFDLERLLAGLDARGQAALTLYYRPERVVSVLLANGTVRVASRDLDPAVVAGLDQYARNLVRGQPDPYLFDPSEELSITAEALVPRALLEAGLAAGSLLVAPHQVLHLLPWPGLLLDGRRLFERTAVGLVPNLTCAQLLDRRFASPPRAALIGAPDYTGLAQLPDLPQAGAELADLEAMYRDRDALVTAPVTAGAATAAAFRDLAGRADVEGAILHAACHATLESAEPMASGLLLCDGKVDAGELALSRLDYDEVVLSACSTGWRPRTAQNVPLTGDDVLGLPGGLLEAGAGAVIVSIPPADDDAARAFMTRYHHARTTGSAPLQGLRAAQLAMLQDASFPPFSWIGFVSYACR